MGNANIKQIEHNAKQSGEFQLKGLELIDIPRLSKFKIDFTKITKFNAEDNKLTCTPKDLEVLVNLTELNLSKNNISQFSTPKLPNLVKIDLGFNPLLAELEDNLERAPNLVSLMCYGCSLRKIPAESLKRMPKLNMLINSNYLSIGHEHIPAEIIPQLSGLNDQKVPSEILPDFLYLGSVSAAQNWEGLQERKITDVLCMVSMHQLPFAEKLKYKLVKIDDIETADIKQHFSDINEYLNSVKQSGRCLLIIS
eukprot:Phypoly_transcript_08870.p1 GENE.Phypoly_transcript_08870~~Phypoly_transcript_08870.p1  ORF type:complete len:253 (-),score=35.06 Phypoly_transcript_08870:300-1058(-)